MTTARRAERPVRLHRRRTALAVYAAALALAAAPATGDDDLPVRLQRPLAVRAGPALFVTLPFGPADEFASVTVSRQLSAPLALELSVGGGGEGSRNGLHLGAAARLWAAGGPRAGLTFALGTRLAFLREYGTVGFAHMEAAYELRLESGFSLVAGGGWGMPLNTSHPSSRCAEGSLFCENRFKAGAWSPFVEGQLGWSF